MSALTFSSFQATSTAGPLYLAADSGRATESKTIAFVIGEQVLAPALDAVAVSFQWIGAQFSRVYHFQVLPGAAAAPLNGNDCSGEGMCEITKDVHAQINSMAPLVSARSGKGILSNWVNPESNLDWFVGAAEKQLTDIFARDFVDSVELCFIANLNLLRGLRFLYTDLNAFKSLKELQTSSYELYDGQLSFNSQNQIRFIQYAEDAYKSLRKVNVWTQQIKADPSKQAVLLPKIQNAEKQGNAARKAFLTKYKEHADTFLEVIGGIKSKIQSTIDVLSTSSHQVSQALDLVNKLSQDRVKLEVEKKSMEEEFDAYQKTKQREFDSRKTELTGGSSISVGGTEIWSTSPKREIVEADFGSAEKFKHYLELKEKTRELEKQIKIEEANLAKALSQINVKANKQDLEQAARSLSAALIAVKNLETAIATKRNNALRQLDTVEMGTRGSEFDTDFPTDYLEDEQRAIIYAQAAWVQSQQQNEALKALRMEEGRLEHLITGDIQNNQSNGLKALEKVLKTLYSSDREGPYVPLIAPQQLLEKIDVQ
ncbi:MAG: hypothetical protein S4CHLAM2_12820 [Chlamydiales bacterium]|nr:hypothetical protein [Chlamydiales bacterium]